jgi:nucleoside-diphosphate-sugar epimerase
MHVVIAGYGWLGTALGRALRARGDRITGIRRSHPEAVRACGAEPLLLDLADPASADRVPADADAIVACQAAGGSGLEAYRAAYFEANRTLLAAARRLRLLGYVYTGSTGVFGQSEEEDVDETTPTAPATASGEILVEAERLVLGAVADGVPARIVRFTGLYGPGRSGVIERVRTGALALGPGDEVWTNWCHQADAVAATLAALDRGEDGRVYHATDAHPASRRELVEWVSARLGIEPPRREADADAVPGRRGANRRVHGERTRAALGLALRYPSFREGLAELF